jgi:hypothetical protein
MRWRSMAGKVLRQTRTVRLPSELVHGVRLYARANDVTSENQAIINLIRSGLDAIKQGGKS